MTTKKELKALKQEISRLRQEVFETAVQQKKILKKGGLYGTSYLIEDDDGWVECVKWNFEEGRQETVLMLDEEDLRKLLRAVKPWWKFW